MRPRRVPRGSRRRGRGAPPIPTAVSPARRAAASRRERGSLHHLPPEEVRHAPIHPRNPRDRGGRDRVRRGVRRRAGADGAGRKRRRAGAAAVAAIGGAGHRVARAGAPGLRRAVRGRGRRADGVPDGPGRA